jgi:hypothetical protein
MTDSIFEAIINSNQENWLGQITTPLMPYFICDHHISTEINEGDSKYIGMKFKIKSNDILKNNNLQIIKNYDVVQVQVDHFQDFCKYILPFLRVNNIRIVLVTSQWHMPQIEISSESSECLESENIVLWISQNPIYKNHKKYMAIPYGLNHLTLLNYIDFVKKNKKITKVDNLFNGHAGSHSHLPSNHIRRTHKIFGENSPERLDYNSYLATLGKFNFAVSTTGDRDDCYRHYECIGLKTIPISNVGDEYKIIFGVNMIYQNANELLEAVNNNAANYLYITPNRDILTIIYWKIKIFNRINEII